MERVEAAEETGRSCLARGRMVQHEKDHRQQETCLRLQRGRPRSAATAACSKAARSADRRLRCERQQKQRAAARPLRFCRACKVHSRGWDRRWGPAGRPSLPRSRVDGDTRRGEEARVSGGQLQRCERALRNRQARRHGQSSVEPGRSIQTRARARPFAAGSDRFAVGGAPAARFASSSEPAATVAKGR